MGGARDHLRGSSSELLALGRHPVVTEKTGSSTGGSGVQGTSDNRDHMQLLSPC